MNINIKALNRELTRNCMSWKDLAEKSGISTVTLARINKGLQNAKPKTIGRLAKALQIDVTEIIENEY